MDEVYLWLTWGCILGFFLNFLVMCLVAYYVPKSRHPWAVYFWKTDWLRIGYALISLIMAYLWFILALMCLVKSKLQMH